MWHSGSTSFAMDLPLLEALGQLPLRSRPPFLMLSFSAVMASYGFQAATLVVEGARRTIQSG
jgi:hypothetical protein